MTLDGGVTQSVLVPTRYPGSEDAADDALRQAQRTDWEARGPDHYRGIGQRMLATDAGEFALLDCRTIKFDARS
jgi:type VI secretion system protein ImpE